MYLSFVGPYYVPGHSPWDIGGVVGIRRFLERVFKMCQNVTPKEISDEQTLALLHRTIKKVGEDIEAFKFNTAVSQMMIFVNHAEKKTISKTHLELFLKILAPFAPHLSEELWEKLGNKTSVHLENWPQFNKDFLQENEYTLIVQVDGKTRDSILLPLYTKEEEVERLALSRPTVVRFMERKQIKKVIHVRGRLINIVTK